MVTHHVRCGVCKDFPITGLRYRCLKCLNFDLCQACFLTGRGSKQHKRTHPVVEHCVQQVSAKDHTKLFLRTVRNNLLRGRCEMKEAQRQKTLAPSEREASTGAHQEATSRVPSTSLALASHDRALPPGTVNTVLQPPEHEKKSKAQHARATESKSPRLQTVPAQVMVCIKEELLKTRESIKALHSERRLLRKQLNRWTEKVQILQLSQEGQNCRLEAKIQGLMASNDRLQAELQRLRQAMQVMLKPPGHPSTRLDQAVEPKNNATQQMGLRRERESTEILETKSSGQREWQTLAPINTGSQQLLGTKTWHTIMKAIPLGAMPTSVLAHDVCRPSGQQEKPGRGYHVEKHQLRKPQSDNNNGDSVAPALASSSTAAEMSLLEKKEEDEGKAEEELLQLVQKLKDTLSLQIQASQPSYMKQEILYAAQRVSCSFSNLINQAAPPAWKGQHGVLFSRIS